MESEFRLLPSVDKLLADKRIKQLEDTYSRQVILSLVRRHLEHLRSSLSQDSSCPSFDQIAESICTQAQVLLQPTLCPVINATGVILHTNLGRAPLSQEAITAMDLISKGYTNLEFDLESGKRGSRQVHVESLICQLTGAEASMVVNNNASGVLLALSAVGRGKGVIVSRGQAVEIGGGFRLPEIMRQSRAKMVEVGTTNCTYLSDYEQAITAKTVAILRVHSSNFSIIGYTQTVGIKELVQLGHRYGLLVLDDLGSGCLLDTTKFGLAHEPMIQESVTAGVELAFSSGDKLLGGPQSGIIVGKRSLIDALKKHPLARAARIDKIRLAGLVVTLHHYLKQEALSKIPIWQMISTPLEEIESRARRLAQALGGMATIVKGESAVGGGSLPQSTLPTLLVTIKGTNENPVHQLARKLRSHQPPIVGRIEKNTLLLDPRTVLPEEEESLLQALCSIIKGN